MVQKKDPKKIAMGKKSKAAGDRFEKRVRADLEKKDWVVDKWSNNVEFNKWIEQDSDGKKFFDKENGKIELRGKLVQTKPMFVFNPKIMRRIMIRNSSGFPDFIAFRMESVDTFDNGKKQKNWRIMGVEAKMLGELDKAEKEKCVWLLKNNIFSKILIASKGTKRGQIIYTDFSEKYQKV